MLVGPGGGGFAMVTLIPVMVVTVWAAVVAAEVAGGGALDLAGAVAGTAGGQQGRQDSAADDAGQVGWALGADARGGDELVAGGSRAVVKLARSGLVPGRVSTALTMAMRSSW